MKSGLKLKSNWFNILVRIYENLENSQDSLLNAVHSEEKMFTEVER